MSKIKLFLFIDALGWQVLEKNSTFMADIAVDRRPLQTILGYSSACDPSIISGLTPAEHGHWSSFYYSPQTCPYRWVKWLGFIPSLISNNHRTRSLLSKLIRKIHGFTGYFQIYNVPFEYLPLFDYAEKNRIWIKNGLLIGKSIFDTFDEEGLPHYVGDQDSEDDQVATVNELIEKKEINFAYLLFGRLDAYLHKYGTQNPGVGPLLEHYEQTIRKVIQNAEANYDEVEWIIFSDHGMHDVTGHYDLAAEISKLGLEYNVDYVAFYDSTMARFWFLNDLARKKIVNFLDVSTVGRILTVDELKDDGVYFPDHQYGETIFLMHSANIIVPSYMGLKPVKGMHGFNPTDPDSLAMIMSNRQIPDRIRSIKDIASLV